MVRLRSLILSALVLGPAVTCQTLPSLRLPIRNVARPETPPPQSGAAPGTQLGGPVQGYTVWPSPLELRPILGVSGASVFGNPVSLPAGITRLHLAPGQAYALTEQEGASNLGRMRLSGTRRSEIAEISGALAQPVLVVFGPTGYFAALYSRDLGQIQVLTGLPDSPRVSRDLAISSLPYGLKVLAINDDGDALVVVDEIGRLCVLGQDNSLSLVYAGAEIAGVSFVPLRADIVVCDRALGNVYLISDVRGIPVASILASNVDVPPTSVAVRTSPDGRAALIANIGADRLSIIDLVSAEVQTLQLPAAADT